MGTTEADGTTAAADIEPPPKAPTVRDDGIWLERNDDVAVDVLIDGSRVWSFNPRRDGRRHDSLFRIVWPASLVPRLNGVATFTVREHVSGSVLIEDEYRVGTGGLRLSITDDQGHPLAVDKTGRLGRQFAERDESLIDALMDGAEQVLAFLTDECGVPAFLTYGGLLGAVRSGRLIGHDVDLDLSYFSHYTSPADIIRESFRIERTFLRAGWRTWRFSANDFKVSAPGVATHARWIDIFGAFVTDGTFYLMGEVAAPPAKAKIEPLGRVELEGRTLPAPADPESFLEVIYGPGWRVPDPSFKFRSPRSTVRRLDGWFRSAIPNRRHWLPFYSSPRAGQVPKGPSDFARWVADRLPERGRLYDIGSGTGRDANWFSAQGFTVTGLDFVPSAIHLGEQAAKRRGLDTQFQLFNLYDLRQVLTLGARLAHEDEPVDLYARFLVHALQDHGRSALWRLADMALRRQGRLFLEFRTGDDSDLAYEFGQHYRNLMSPESVAAEIEARGGTIEYQETGRGLAVLKNEDPLICRMVATWQR